MPKRTVPINFPIKDVQIFTLNMFTNYHSSFWSLEILMIKWCVIGDVVSKLFFHFYLPSFFPFFILLLFQFFFLCVFMVCAYDCRDAHSCSSQGRMVSVFFYLCESYFIQIGSLRLKLNILSVLLASHLLGSAPLPLQCWPLGLHNHAWLFFQGLKIRFSLCGQWLTHWTIALAPPCFC